jgi:putative flippase GtrA
VLIRRLRSHESGLLGQGLRFGLAGATVAGVYVLSTLLLVHVLGLGFEAALPIGFAIAITVHFTLQRTFVWIPANACALPIRRQLPRDLTIALTQYGMTALALALLPRALGVKPDVVYLCCVVLLTILSFLLLRARVFHPDELG